MNKEYIAEFEGLRGLMAWWVVVGHMSQFAGFDGSQSNIPWYQYIVLRGSVPVDVFITLSGFVIFFLLKNSKKFDYINFSVNRFFRIYPAFLVSFLLALITMPLVSTVVSSPWADPSIIAAKIARLDSTEKNIAIHIALHLSLLHGLIADQWLPFAGDSILGPAWSLSLEWQFYLVAPLFFFIIKMNSKQPSSQAAKQANRFIYIFILLCFLILFLKFLIVKNNYSFSYGSFLPMHFEFFMLGMGSFLAWEKSQQTHSFFAGMKIMSVGLFVAFFVMAFLGGMREHFYPVFIWVVVFSSALWKSITGKVVFVSKVLLLPKVQYIGRISYSTYILHVVIVNAIGWVMVFFAGGNNFSRELMLMVMIAVGFPVIFCASILLNKYIEKPGIQFGKKVNSYMLKARVNKGLINE